MIGYRFSIRGLDWSVALPQPSTVELASSPPPGCGSGGGGWVRRGWVGVGSGGCCKRDDLSVAFGGLFVNVQARQALLSLRPGLTIQSKRFNSRTRSEQEATPSDLR